MKRFYSFLFLFITVFLLTGCEKETNNGLAKIHWDRDTCERCVMVISEKGYAVQIENPVNKQKHKFDDMGCAVIWFKQNNYTWFDSAIIWVKDENSKTWINARTALWTTQNITPMNYGLAAYTKETFPLNKKSLNFYEAVETVYNQHSQDNLRRQHQMHNKGN